MILASNIKKYRALFNLSQDKLAAKIGVDLGTINKIETCKQFPSYKTLSKMIEFFAIEPYQLFLSDGAAEFEREKYIETVYPLIIKDIQSRMKNTKIP